MMQSLESYKLSVGSSTFMTTNYDSISEEYRKSKFQPWRTHVESFSVFEVLGSVSGKSVLDLACGEGFYSRILKHHGADRVVGVDLSQGMINLARKQEIESPLEIDYFAHDARDLELNEKFDVVFAAYLLNYSQNLDDLVRMCKTIKWHLRPGGRFVSVNSNPNYTGSSSAMRKYGFERDATPGVDGEPVVYRFYDEKGVAIEVTNYHLNKSLHGEAFDIAGLRGLKWHSPRVSPEGLSKFGESYWADMIKYEPAIVLEVCHP